ncbi:LOB domain-containing protein 1-like [Arachis duranensis]|uniref:LOB domain-containing protein 1-like n=1 Tax=Arachis duranensis TaxID=130453 RepID=A0A6P4BVB0_ARADU|nr:LOB domain-containing protein 1-like [Arachis duranensis]
MEASDTNTPISSSQSPTSSSSLPPPPQVIMSPCAACKILRRRCAEKCVLAPYFPPTEPAKFTTAHRVFGASNIIKFLQELPESQRADAVTSMVYEAGARIRDPVYGCAGAICQLQTQVNELQAQLAKAQAEIANMQFQQANMVALLYMQMAEANNKATATTQEPPPSPQQSVDNFIASPPHINNNLNFFDDNNTSLNSMWELFGHDHITTF